MKRASDVIGLPIVCVCTGNQIGVVKDIACDPESNVFGIIIEPKTLFNKGKAILLEDVTAIGKDAVTVYLDNIAKSVEEMQKKTDELLRGLYYSEKLRGIKVLTANGVELGIVEDVYFDEELGTIVGYELSEGVVADITEGRKYLPKPDHLTEGKDILIVPRSAIDEVEDLG
ncbi:PRC-barrel domain-containing protein [Desulfuribacillus alkaliarsenatis]|uniref:PRC-barrel domain-containing protein n=1 Tax=Desulfuribacillus alkaliarsenatis TaxID=766136 RepID=A0A1E5G0L0_9FIRM|nr:PRC-barrel domain-containing protein [Desulfuribacillus alkaliarsenatis]OEF96376.1 hypothetical protein BHF68_09140 [Desulfuribacillus alkaliarsenatis]